MNEAEFREKWNTQKPLHEAWGNFVVKKITDEISLKGKNINFFLKIPASYRTKDDTSLIDKAFYRKDKSYADPYSQIEDKVGARFVVLFLEDIDLICDIIQAQPEWSFDPCKHFNDDREKSPLLFTYQSVHYILRPAKIINLEGLEVDDSIACEVQIRTLLQHAHAELTHDAIYKTQRAIQPKVHRTVAKSMALIETTDEFFKEVNSLLDYGPLEEHKIIPQLDKLYFELTGITPHNQKSSIFIWDAFEKQINDSLIESIREFLKEIPDISNAIKSKYTNTPIYQQSIVIFIYWMIRSKKSRLLTDWPLARNLLTPLANDLGVSLSDGP